MRNIIFGFVLIIFGCNKNAIKSDIKQIDFENYYKCLPVLKIPIVLNSGLQYDFDLYRENDKILFNQLLKIDSNFREKFFPSASYNSVNGRIFENKDFISIIYRCDAEFIWPALYTYSKSGDKIDSLSLNTSFGGDVGVDEIQTTIIDNKMYIMFYDTARFNDFDSISGPLSSIDYIVIMTKKYSTRDDGKFIKIYERRDSIDY